MLNYAFAGEDDVFSAEDRGAAGDFVAGFLGGGGVRMALDWTE